MDDNPEIRDRLNVNKSTYHNKPLRERCYLLYQKSQMDER